MTVKKSKPRFSQEQYDMLKRCSDKKDMTEWNKWRENNPEKEVLLENANLRLAHLENAKLWHANLKNANLEFTHLEGADFFGAHLKGASLYRANIESANFEGVEVDASTVLRECQVDRCTSFQNVSNLRIMSTDSGMRELLEYNVRRLNWEKWYKYHPVSKWPARFFWWLSDYGASTWRGISGFFLLAFSFAAIYYALGAWDYYIRDITEQPGIINNLFADDQGPVEGWIVPVRAIYFSIVTMTTLGFGDMYAHAQGFLGHLLLMVQVLWGYIILAILVMRLSVVTRSDGPQAAKLTKIRLKDMAKAEKDKKTKK